MIITTATILISFCFYIVAHIYKMFQNDAMNHSWVLEILLQPERLDQDRGKCEAEYVFGIGHAIQLPTAKLLFKTMTNRKLWHFHGFFLLICLLAVVADIWILKAQ